MATETTSTSGKAWAPDVTAIAPDELVGEALIQRHATDYGELVGDEPLCRVALVDDSAATIVAEGDPIPEADPDLSEMLVASVKIAQLVRVSRELSFAEGTPERLAASSARALVNKADQMFIGGPAPVSPAIAPPAGLVNTTGIVAGAELTASLDELIDLVATLQANGALPSAILASPTAWARLRRLKTATASNESLLGAGTSDATKALLGIPVEVSAAVPTGTGLVIDKSAIASVSSSVEVAVDGSVYFASDSVGVRTTWRLGWGVAHPDRLGTFTVADPVA